MRNVMADSVELMEYLETAVKNILEAKDLTSVYIIACNGDYNPWDCHSSYYNMSTEGLAVITAKVLSDSFALGKGFKTKHLHVTEMRLKDETI